MAAIAHSSASTRIRQIILTTARHFSIPIRPHRRDPRLVLYGGEFKDPMPFRWRNTPAEMADLGDNQSSPTNCLRLSNS